MSDDKPPTKLQYVDAPPSYAPQITPLFGVVTQMFNYLKHHMKFEGNDLSFLLISSFFSQNIEKSTSRR